MRVFLGVLVLGALVLPRHAAPAEVGVLAPQAVAQFYEKRQGAPAWSDDARFDELLQAIEQLADHGLNPAHYHLDALRANRSNPEAREKPATDAWFAAAAHMVYGKLDPQTYEPNWTAAHRQRDLASDLEQALASGYVADSLSSLASTYPEYIALMQELKRLRIQRESPTVIVPDGPSLKPGMTGVRVQALQARLVQLGLMTETDASGILDPATEDAVREFQTSAGLDVDGVAGPATLEKLNQSLENRMRQLRVNLERWRWLPEDLGERHIRANIADFLLSAYEQGTRERTHAIIVGRLYRRTPVFSDRIKYVVLNPWWETPPSITRKDKLPLFKENPAAVDELGFQILDESGSLVPPASIDWASLTEDHFPYRIRQAPGPLNALGRIKIMFPNKHNVYLHDTPTRDLFAERKRTFSSGCVRTQDPVDLAAWLFEDTPDWNKTRFESVIATGNEMRVDLPSPVSVHILYFTVAVDDVDAIRYLDDVYDRDPNVLAGLMETDRSRGGGRSPVARYDTSSN